MAAGDVAAILGTNADDDGSVGGGGVRVFSDSIKTNDFSPHLFRLHLERVCC